MNEKVILEAIDEMATKAGNKIKGIDDRLQSIEKDAAANQKALDSLIAGANTPLIISSGSRKSLTGLILDAVKLDDIVSIREGRLRDVKFISKAMTFPVNFPSAAGSVDDRAIGVVGTMYQPRHVDEIFFRTPMTTSQIPIVKEGSTVGDFATVAEGAAKPLVDFNLSETPAKAQTIAAIVKVSRQMFFDLGEVDFANWMVQKLTEMYQNELGSQILNGDGVSPNLSGINTAGNFTAATSLPADNDLEQLVEGVVQLQILGRSPSQVIIHPASLPTLLLNTAVGSGEFNIPAAITVSPTGQIAVMGVPVFSTIAQVPNTYTIIDNRGYTIGDRETFSIRIFEQDQDDVQKNMLTLRAESRTAFAVYAATYAVKGTFV